MSQRISYKPDYTKVFFMKMLIEKYKKSGIKCKESFLLNNVFNVNIYFKGELKSDILFYCFSILNNFDNINEDKIMDTNTKIIKTLLLNLPFFKDSKRLVTCSYYGGIGGSSIYSCEFSDDENDGIFNFQSLDGIQTLLLNIEEINLYVDAMKCFLIGDYEI